MNLSREVLKVWHSCGLSENSFWLSALWSFIIRGAIQCVVASMIRNMEREIWGHQRERVCVETTESKKIKKTVVSFVKKNIN